MRKTVFCLAIMSSAYAVSCKSDPLHYAYRGAGCDGNRGISTFEIATGLKVDGPTDFLAFDSWSSMQSDANWALGCWRQRQGRISIGVPLIVKGATLAAAANGQYDKSFADLGKSLVVNKQPSAFIRLGWEFNGNWYPWSAGKDGPTFKSAFRHVVGVLRDTPGQHFVVVWNPSVGTGESNLAALYPGDDAVDLIGADVYNQSWRPQDQTDPVARWQHLSNGPFGLDSVRAFAAAHRKPIAIPEWGTGLRPDGHGLGDDPIFVHKMISWMRAQHVVFDGYWDYSAGDYDARFSNGRNPLALAAYRADFNHQQR